MASVTDRGSDGNAILLTKSGPTLTQNSLNLEAIKKGFHNLLPSEIISFTEH